jgi:hypothetical protein
MSGFDTTKDKQSTKRSKSRNSIQNRNNSVILCNKISANKTEYDSISSKTHNSPSSIIQNIISDQALDHYNTKIKDLSAEKQQLLDVINSNEKEIDFLNQIIRNFVDLNEVFKIKQNSEYDNNTKTWNIPAFVVQQRKTIFPKLPKAQLKEAVKNEVKQKKIVFKPQIVAPGQVFNHEFDKEIKFSPEEARPATSLAKHRQGSLAQRGVEQYDDSRRSPIFRRKNCKLV